MYLYLLPVTTLFIIFFYINFQTILHIFNNVLFKCRNNYLVTQNKNCIDKCYNKFNFLKFILILAYNTFKILLIQRLNKLTITPISKNIYTVEFVIGGKIYKLYTEHSKSPSNILQIINESDQDITSELEPILNLNYIIPTVKDLGYKELTIMDSNGDDHILSENDKLII